MHIYTIIDMMTKSCLLCLKTFNKWGNTKYCSRRCYFQSESYLAMVRKNGAKGKDKMKKPYKMDRGYKMLLMRSNPMADSFGYVYEHRLIMANHIGRMLGKNEIVHHINRDKGDNRISNLVLTNRKEHMSHHQDLFDNAKKAANLSKEDIEKMYIIENKTLKQIASEIGASITGVRNMVKKYGFSGRLGRNQFNSR